MLKSETLPKNSDKFAKKFKLFGINLSLRFSGATCNNGGKEPEPGIRLTYSLIYYRHHIYDNNTDNTYNK